MVSSMGPEAVAAVGLTTQPKFIGLCIFIATNVSVSALVARRQGREGPVRSQPGAFNGSGLYPGGGDADQYGLRVLCRSHHRLCGANEDTQAGAVRYF